MPNWVTNKITAPPHVIAAMLDADGKVDFGAIAKFQGPHEWDGVSCAAEEGAEIICGKPLSEWAPLRMLQEDSRRRFDIKALLDEEFEQLVGMLRNYRACGYLHSMDFAREVWGTKWNACEPEASVDDGCASFDTAWSCPKGLIKLLSEKFPDDEIIVRFADEDIGSNCGTFSIKGGAVVREDIAPAWSEQSAEERTKWRQFACELTGSDPADYEDEQAA